MGFYLDKWEIGVLVAIFGCFAGTLGGQLRIASLTCSGDKTALFLQLFGWASWLCGQFMGQVAISLAPATLTACVTLCSSLLWNALLAPCVLRETLHVWHIIGIVLLTVGGSVVTVSSNHTNTAWNWKQLDSFAMSPNFVHVGSVCLVVAAAIAFYSFKLKELGRWGFAYFFALCGSVDLLVTKCALQLLRLSFFFPKADVPSNTVVVGFVCLMMILHGLTFVCQVRSAYYRNSLESLPLFLGSGALLQVGLCGCFFQEFNGFSHMRAFSFIIGFTLALAGMLVTTTAVAKKDEPLDVTPVSMPETGKLDEEHTFPSVLHHNHRSLSSADLLLDFEMRRCAHIFAGEEVLPAIAGGNPKCSRSTPCLTDPMLHASVDDMPFLSEPLTPKEKRIPKHPILSFISQRLGIGGSTPSESSELESSPPPGRTLTL